MPQQRIEGDLFVTGNISSGSLTPPAGSVTDNSVLAGAAIAYTKVGQLHIMEGRYLTSTTAFANTTSVVGTIYGATATLLEAKVGSVAAGTTGTYGFDVKKNGSSVLTGVLSAGSGASKNTAYTLYAATLNTTGAVAGDVYTVHLTTVAGSPDNAGMFWRLVFSETPS